MMNMKLLAVVTPPSIYKTLSRLFMLEPLPSGYSCLVWPYSCPTWIVGDVHHSEWIFLGVWSITLLLEHLLVKFLFLEVAWSSTFNFFLSLASQSLSLMHHLSFDRFCCTSASLGVPVVVACSVLGVFLYPFHHFHHIYIYILLEDPLHFLCTFLVTLSWRVLGVLRHSFLVHSGLSLEWFPKSLLIGESLFAKLDQWICKLIDPRILDWNRFFLHPIHCLFLEEMIGLIKALAELRNIYCPAVDISSYCRTWCIGRISC